MPEQLNYSESRQTEENKSFISALKDAIAQDGIDHSEAKKLYEEYEKLRSDILAITTEEIAALAKGLELDEDATLMQTLHGLKEKSQKHDWIQAYYTKNNKKIFTQENNFMIDSALGVEIDSIDFSDSQQVIQLYNNTLDFQKKYNTKSNTKLVEDGYIGKNTLAAMKTISSTDTIIPTPEIPIKNEEDTSKAQHSSTETQEEVIPIDYNSIVTADDIADFPDPQEADDIADFPDPQEADDFVESTAVDFDEEDDIKLGSITQLEEQKNKIADYDTHGGIEPHSEEYDDHVESNSPTFDEEDISMTEVVENAKLDVEAVDTEIPDFTLGNSINDLEDDYYEIPDNEIADDTVETNYTLLADDESEIDDIPPVQVKTEKIPVQIQGASMVGVSTLISRFIDNKNNGESEVTNQEPLDKEVSTDTGNKSENTDEHPKSKIEDLAYQDELIDYFGIEDSEGLITSLNEVGLNLMVMLEGYKNFIEEKLGGLDPEITSKIIQSISIKISHIDDMINDFKEDMLKKEGNLDDFINNRWILNQHIQDSFGDMNGKVLGSAYFLLQYENDKAERAAGKGKEESFVDIINKDIYYGHRERKRLGKSLEIHLEEIHEMFDAEINEEGDFDEGFFSSQKGTISANDPNDIKKLKNLGFQEEDIQDFSLLNEQDKEIEANAQFYFISAIVAQLTIELGPVAAASIFPVIGTAGGTVAGAVAGGTIDIVDVFSDTEVLLDIVQKAGLVDPDYRMEKTWIDNILAGIGLVPGLTPLIKAKKVAEFLEKYPDFDIKKGSEDVLNAMLGKTQQIDTQALKSTFSGYTEGIKKILPTIPSESLKFEIEKNLVQFMDTLGSIKEASAEKLQILLLQIEVIVEHADFKKMDEKSELKLLLTELTAKVTEQLSKISKTGLEHLEGHSSNLAKLLNEIKDEKIVRNIQSLNQSIKGLKDSGISLLAKSNILLKKIDDLRNYVKGSGEEKSDEIVEQLTLMEKILQKKQNALNTLKGLDTNTVDSLKTLRKGDEVIDTNGDRYIVTDIDQEKISLQMITGDGFGDTGSIKFDKIRKTGKNAWLGNAEHLQNTLEAKTRNLIHTANSIEQLIATIHEIGKVGKYEAEDMINGILHYVQSPVADNTGITRLFGLREKVAVLRNKEIVAKDSVLGKLWPRGLDNITRQGQVGNCYFLSGLNAIKTHPNGPSILSNMIRETPDGWIVRFHEKRGMHEILVTPEMLKNKAGAHIQSDNIGDEILERAHASLISRRRTGEEGNTMIHMKNDKGEILLPYEGGYPAEVFEDFFGTNIESSFYAISSQGKIGKVDPSTGKYIDRDIEKKDVFTDLISNKEKIINLSSRSGANDTKTYQKIDFDGNIVNLYHSHAYTLETFDKAEGSFTVINPHNSSERIKFKITELFNSFQQFHIGEFK